MGKKTGIRIPFVFVIPLALISIIFQFIFCANITSRVVVRPTPQPTQDMLKLQSLAITKAWLYYTMTALSLPTNTAQPTSTITNTPAPTQTSIPTATLIPSPLPTATMFFSKLPVNQPQNIVTVPVQQESGACCKYCSNSQPCGDSCISLSKTCHKPPGCACK